MCGSHFLLVGNRKLRGGWTRENLRKDTTGCSSFGGLQSHIKDRANILKVVVIHTKDNKHQ